MENSEFLKRIKKYSKIEKRTKKIVEFMFRLFRKRVKEREDREEFGVAHISKYLFIFGFIFGSEEVYGSLSYYFIHLNPKKKK